MKGRLLEQIAADMYQSASFTVQTRVHLQGVDDPGSRREIDVLGTCAVAGIPIQIAIECKNEGKPIGVEYIDAFVGKLQHVGIPLQHGIYVSACGYTRDARRRAKRARIKTLELKGLTPDRLASVVAEVAQSTVFVVPTLISARTSAAPEPTSVGAPAFCNADGEYVGALPDLVWKLWTTGPMDLTLGAKTISLRFAEPLFLHGDEGKAQITDFTVDLIVRGHVLTLPGQAQDHGLIDAETRVIERRRLHATFTPCPGTYQLRTVASEPELAQLVSERDLTSFVLSRIRVPRILVGPMYWPPSDRVYSMVTSRLREADEYSASGSRPPLFAFNELEGSDIRRAWEPPMESYRGLSQPDKGSLRFNISVEPAAAVMDYARLTQSARDDEDGLAHHQRIGQEALALMQAIGDHFGQAQALGHLGTVAYRRGRCDEALERYDQSLTLRRAIGDQLGQARVQIGKGFILQQQGSWDRAMACYRLAIDLGEAARNRRVQAEAQQLLGDLQLRAGRWDEATDLLERSLRTRREVGDDSGKAEALISIGSLNSYRGQWTSARTTVEEALRVTQACGDRPMEAVALLNLGCIHLKQGTLDLAQACFDQSLSIAHELKDQVLESEVLANVADVYSRRGEWLAARRALEQSLEMRQKIGDRAFEGSVWNKLGLIYREIGDYIEAQACCEKSLAIRREIGDKYGEAFSLSALSSFALDQGRLDDATARLTESLAIRQSLNDPHGIAENQLHLGQVLLARQEWEPSMPLIQQALVAFRKLGDPYFEACALMALGDCHNGQELPDEAGRDWNAALSRLPKGFAERALIMERLATDHASGEDAVT